MIKIRKLMTMAAAAAAVTGAVVFAPATAAPAPPARAAAVAVTKPAAPAAYGTAEKSLAAQRQAAGKAALLPKPHHVAWKQLKRNRAMDYAEAQRGCWYQWGGTGPCGSGYDCSGLVMMAYEHVGIYLPRTTYDMLASPLLVRTYHPKRGDLAFYGSGHVELVTRRTDTTFGAHDSGTRIGYARYSPGGGWQPTAFYKVKGSRK